MDQERLGQYGDLIEEASRVATLDEVHDFCSKLCRDFGFDFFIYGMQMAESFVKPCQIIVSGYPAEWRERYVAESYQKIDPTVSHCLKNVVPLPWAKLPHFMDVTPTVQKFMDAGRDHGLCTGISFPVHSPRGEMGIFSLASRQTSLADDGATAGLTTLLHGLAFHIHEATLRSVSTRDLAPDDRLSVRERECLLWAAEGKTSWETSQILGISERTVVFHLQNAAEKLQVSNRLHAVARAVARGIIVPAL